MKLDEIYEKDEKHYSVASYNDEDSDDEKDEPDVMKEIQHGTRRSGRSTKNQRPIGLHFGVDPNFVHAEDEIEDFDTRS